MIAKIENTICEAIRTLHLVILESGGCERVVEPHDYGIISCARKLFFFQVGGQSRSVPPTGWRWASLSNISGARILEERFPGPRAAPSGRHYRWERLIASVSRQTSP
jgi:hypothetical protein